MTPFWRGLRRGFHFPLDREGARTGCNRIHSLAPGKDHRILSTGPEVAITAGVWAMGLLILTVLYKIAIEVKVEKEG